MDATDLINYIGNHKYAEEILGYRGGKYENYTCVTIFMDALKLGQIDEQKIISFDNDADNEFWETLDKYGIIEELLAKCTETSEIIIDDDEDEMKHGKKIAVWQCWDGAITGIYMDKYDLINLIITKHEIETTRIHSENMQMSRELLK